MSYNFFCKAFVLLALNICRGVHIFFMQFLRVYIYHSSPSFFSHVVLLFYLGSVLAPCSSSKLTGCHLHSPRTWWPT